MLKRWTAKLRAKPDPEDDFLVWDLQVGQTLNATVVDVHPGGRGCFLDVGVEKIGYMRACEYNEGFPTDIPQVGSVISVRVQKLDEEQFFLTRRPGSLQRAQSKRAPKYVDVRQFMGLPEDMWLDAEVCRLTTQRAYVLVALPDGGPVAEARLNKEDFAEGFEREIDIGTKLQVRIAWVNLKKERILATMHPPEPSEVEEHQLEVEGDRMPVSQIEVGQSFEGVVTKFLRRGCFVDIGAERDGYMIAAEFTDGFPSNVSDLQEGCKVTVRVLSVADDTFSLTRRAGDLARPPVKEAPKPNDVTGFMGVDEDMWFNGEVNAITTYAVFLLVTPPMGGQISGAQLNKKDFAEGFASSVRIGDTVRVRIKELKVLKRQLWVTMKAGKSATPR